MKGAVMSERLKRDEPGIPTSRVAFATPEARSGPGEGPSGAGARLVHVTTVPATLGFLRGQIGYFKSRGYQVWAVSSPGPALESFGADQDIKTCSVPMERNVTPLADLWSLVRMWFIFRKIRPAIVHGHTPKGGLLAMIAAFLAGVPWRVYSVHGLPLETATGWRRLLLKWTERVSCLLAHRVLPVSPSLSRRVVEERLCLPHKLRVLGQGTVNGVDATHRFVPGAEQFRAAREFRQELGIQPESMVIGFVGRIVRDKGVPELVRAWGSLRPEFPEAHLVIAGDFEPRDRVPEETERMLRKDPRIHLLGHTTSMSKVLAAMDVVALPTYREGFPQVPLEAAAMERPVVATRVTGCVDAVVDGVTGTLVDAGDPVGLAAAIRKYLHDPELRQAHGRAARMRVLRDFRPDSLCRALEAEYRVGMRNPDGGHARPVPVERAVEVAPLPGRPLEHALKRIVDLCGATSLLVLLSPVMALVALGTWATLGAPILFRQRRPGLKGRPFVTLKFRTMRDGPEKDAVRMTRLGRLLRHLSLDEIPQLLNVVRGEMSLVGPRPLLMSYLDRYTPRLRKRHDVKPGITGWCQVNGRNSLTWDQKFEYDLWYVERWSLLLDFKILAMTVGRVARKAGIEGPGYRCWSGSLTIAPEGHASVTDMRAQRSE